MTLKDIEYATMQEINPSQKSIFRSVDWSRPRRLLRDYKRRLPRPVLVRRAAGAERETQERQ